MIHFQKAKFLLGAAELEQLPPDEGYEIAFVGRSNAGKSSALNALTQQKSLARTSKTPGRTQQINVFVIDEYRRLIDLPGYGFAKVSIKMRMAWEKTLSRYLETRDCLKGLVLLMDGRHPLKEIDCTLINWSIDSKLACHVVLTKCDKLKNSEKNDALKKVQQVYGEQELVTIQLFSATKKTGLNKLTEKVSEWMR